MHKCIILLLQILVKNMLENILIIAYYIKRAINDSVQI